MNIEFMGTAANIDECKKLTFHPLKFTSAKLVFYDKET